MGDLQKEDYAKIWAAIVPDPHTYSFGQRRQKQFQDFLEQVKFTNSDWSFWMTKLNTQEPMERKFMKYLIKYRYKTRLSIVRNSFTTQITESQNSKYEPEHIGTEII